MSEDFDKKLKTQSLNKGLILGLIVAVLNILSFYYMTSMTTSLMLIFLAPVVLSIILPIVLAVLLSSSLRKSIGGYWDFKQAVKGIFIMFFAAYIMSYLLGSVLFAKIIEPDMATKTESAIMNAMTSVKAKTPDEQAAIDKKIDEIQKQIDEQKSISVGKQIQSFGIGIIFIFVVALIFAAIFKKDKPLYLTDTDGIDPTVAEV